MTAKKWDNEKFENLMGHIEKLVQNLEKGDQPLEDSLKSYEQGIQLIQVAQIKLQNMETRIEKLMADGTITELDPSEMAAVAQES
jgi:exodeoxyribonuclease VII small subunit